MHPAIIRFIKENAMTKYVEIFEADYTGLRSAREFAAITWNIGDLEKRYRNFARKYESLRLKFKRKASEGHPMQPAECFADRFCMTAEYVALKLDDPMLPLVLLPKEWVGVKAEKVHDAVWHMFRPAAEEFISAVLKK
jgi:phenylacetic acid degradation operon negative regulatory protein